MTPISLPVAPFAVGAGALLLGGLDAMTQPHAEKELAKRLGQLSGATDRSCQTLHEAAPHLGMLQTLAEALAEPAK
ncbi:hypothetical protein [Streptomyces sp. WM6373]|uniref:hypothetical protein n=1 Tax=Streptomyces sp. WM6373 TaxID=1415556 RepID=UPI000A54199A|nr:hypothetical protein [Streptomyces sp. WM6373]